MERGFDKNGFGDKIKERARSLGNFESQDNINCYPSEHKGGCHKTCLGLAFNVHNGKSGDPLGFKGVAEKLIQHWNLCGDRTKRTLLITFSWDEVSFKRDYKEDFDEFNRAPDKSAAIVLVTPMGLSLQYIR